MAAQGADIIDIGGESTGPSAEQVEESQEQKRVIEVIKRLRSELPDIPISIDTYRASTARAAVAAGASIVNDVSGGMLDGEMLSTVAQLKKPFICTHAGQIGKHSIIDYQDGNPSILDSSMKSEDIVRIVRSQISSRVDACIAAGIPRWNLILDPGLGFGKSGAVNFTLLKRLEDVFSGSLEGFPVMIGASRKRFVRDLKNDGQSWSNTEYEAMVGTAAVTAASIAQSQRAQFHRLHDVGEMRRVVDICDRIFRSRE
jgi:dihydropteroate synthase